MKAYEQYISKASVEKIHENTLRILSEIGVNFENERALEVFKKHGTRVEGETVFIDEKMLDAALQAAPEKFMLYSSSYKNMEIGGGSMMKIALASNIYIQDGERIRKTTNEDNINQFKMGIMSPVIDSAVLNQFPDTKQFTAEEKIFGVYAMDLKYSGKSHINANEMTLGLDPGAVYGLTRKGIQLIKEFEGIRDRYVCYRSLNVLSPLTYDSAPIEKIFAACDEKQPLILSPCAMPVLTGPPSVAGILSMNNAEILAGLVLIQLIRPGTGFVYGNTSGSSDLKTLQLTIGTPETALIAYGTAALADRYGLPFRTGGSLSDAKDLDGQAGAETMMLLKATIDVQPDVIYHTIGTLGTFNVLSLEKFTMDEEIIGMLERERSGIDCSEEKLCFDAIRKVGPRGTFLKGRTPKMYREEFYKTSLFNKEDPNQWQNEGGISIKEKAGNEVQKRLEAYEAPDRTKDQCRLLDAFIPKAYREGI